MTIIKKKLHVLQYAQTTPVAANKDQKNVVLWVKVGELPDDLKLDPNARRANTSSPVAREIATTLWESPEMFWKLNSGIQMTARAVKVGKNPDQVTLELFDPEDDGEVADGIVNGGHTYSVIQEVREAIKTAAGDPESLITEEAAKATLEAVVRVEVMTGIGYEELADISQARNTGQAVKKYSLQNLKRLYDPIKEVLGPEECERVGFMENDIDHVPGKTYQVVDIIRLLSLFNNQLYPYEENRHPVPVYTSAGKVVDKWETQAESFVPLLPKLRELMVLHDKVYVALAVSAARPGRPRNGFERKEHTLPFTGTKVDWQVSLAYVFPILASLRVLLDEDYNWQTDPGAFIGDHVDSLIAIVMAKYENECRNKPHECGRSVSLWSEVALLARSHFAESFIPKRSKRGGGSGGSGKPKSRQPHAHTDTAESSDGAAPTTH